jgi:hypothetical protein
MIQHREALTINSIETKSCPSEAEGGASSFCQVFFGYFLWRQKVMKRKNRRPETGKRRTENGQYDFTKGVRGRRREGASASVTFLRHTEIKVEK